MHSIAGADKKHSPACQSEAVSAGTVGKPGWATSAISTYNLLTLEARGQSHVVTSGHFLFQAQSDMLVTEQLHWSSWFVEHVEDPW